MSTLSKVTIGTTREGLEFIKKYVKETTKDVEVNNEYMSAYKITNENEDYLFIDWDWINFYKEIPEVSAIYEALDIMGKEGIPYRMGIIGEDYQEYGSIEKIEDDEYDKIPQIYTEIKFTYES